MAWLILCHVPNLRTVTCRKILYDLFNADLPIFHKVVTTKTMSVKAANFPPHGDWEVMHAISGFDLITMPSQRFAHLLEQFREGD